MSDLKIGSIVRTVNIQDPDEICHNGMVGEVVEYDPDYYKGGQWPWHVKTASGYGWFSELNLEVVK